MTVAVGVVGFGLAGRVLHTPLILDAGMEVTAVVTSQTALAKEQLPTARVFADLESMLAEAHVDLVVITTPNHLHVSQAMAALTAGRHVIVDKPFALHSQEAQALIASAQSQDQLLTVFHNRRWDSDFLTVRRLLDEKKFGEVQRLEARWDRYRPNIVDRWRERPQAGGGLLNDLGPHLIDQALCLFGMPDWLEAEVQMQRAGATVDDAFEIRMGKGNTSIVLSAGSMVAEPTPRFFIKGPAGSFIKYGLDVQEAQLREGMAPQTHEFGMEPASQWGTYTDANTGAEIVVPSERGDWRHYYRAVSNSIQHGQRLPVAAGDALAVLKIIEAARQSSEQRCRIHFAG